MKTTKAKLSIKCAVMAVLLMTMACSKNNPLNPLGDCGSGGWAQKISKELNDWSTAASNYSGNPTVANCTSYKNAAKNYLDALESVRGCVVVNKADFDKAIIEAKAEVDQADCSGS